MRVAFGRYTFSRLFSIKSWLKCWKHAESLLGTLDMVAKLLACPFIKRVRQSL